MTPLDALYRAQRAWEATQPQLLMELWPDDGLGDGETAHSAAEHAGLPIAEPVSNPLLGTRGGLDPGAEPSCDLRELTANRSYAAPPVTLPRAGGSAPLINTTGPGAPPAKGTRPAQRRTV